MRTNPGRWAGILLPAVLLFVGASKPARSNPSCQAADSVSAFLRAPTLESWTSLDNAVRSGCYPAESLIARFLAYHSAREKRDLPNSMTLTDISPDEFVRKQAQTADAYLAQLRTEPSGEPWPLLQALASQSFDDDLVFTSAEIAVRIDPARFERPASDALKPAPQNAWIFDRTRERWLRQLKQ